MDQTDFPHKARKRFGQNFLVNPFILQKIAEQIAPGKQDHMIEIGPGRAALTRLLLPAVKQLEAIELDRDLVNYLRHKFKAEENLTIYQADALDFDYEQFSTQAHSLRIVGNLPYNISTPLLFKLFSHIHLIKDMHFMLQKEVVERLTAKKNSKHYSRLSVMAQFFCMNTSLLDVPADAFKPAPKVQSAFIRMIPQTQKPDVNINALSKTVKQAFNFRRKTLSNSLKKLISAEQLTALNIDPRRRPQELSVEDFVIISNHIT